MKLIKRFKLNTLRGLTPKANKGQTALEYVMMLVVVIIPVSMAVNALMQDSSDEKKDNVIHALTVDAYGDETRLGVIGRPYP